MGTASRLNALLGICTLRTQQFSCMVGPVLGKVHWNIRQRKAARKGYTSVLTASAEPISYTRSAYYKYNSPWASLHTTQNVL